MNFKRASIRIISAVLALICIISAVIPSFAVTVKNDEDVPVLTITDKIVEVARAQKGFYESNINEFTTWYYGVPTDAYWCSIFVSWCANQVGACGSAVPKRASCESMRSWFESREQYYPSDSDYIPQKGDIVFLNTAVDGTNDVHHVEIVTENGFFGTKKNPKVKCIGGNTSNENFEGSEYVTEKTRPVNGSRATLVGYAHPDYSRSEGLLGLFFTLLNTASPSFITYIYSKFISLITMFN